MIFNIQRYSTHDGEGIRTLIFFKGCTLHCQWCSNPEGIPFGPTLLYDERLCKDLGECLSVAAPSIQRNDDGHGIRIDRNSIKHPEILRDVCPAKALTVVGEEIGVEELLEEIEKDRRFYRDNGGVTLSGGEPLAQSDFLVPLLQELKKRGIPADVETSLHVEWKSIAAVKEWVDTFLVDLKHTDAGKFRTYTGGDVRLVMENLKKLVEGGARVIIRVPVIPGFNHSQREMIGIIDHAHALGIEEIHFLPYHTLGMEKYRMMGREYLYGQYRSLRDEDVHSYIEYAQSKGLRTKTGG